MLECRLIVDEPADGAWNMAVDETLLQTADEHHLATLRFYRWIEPTLSLGYFQPYVARALHPASLTCPVVRRSTGGGAIVHDQELTYSFSFPLLGGATDSTVWYRVFHETLIQVFACIEPSIHVAQWSTAKLDAPACKHTQGPLPEPFLCFQRRSAEDVVVGPWKIAGSAQRKRRGAILQHGSVLLRRSPAAPELPGWFEQSKSMQTIQSLIEHWIPLLVNRLALQTGGTPWSRRTNQTGRTEDVMTNVELHQVCRFRDDRFGQRTWSERK